MNVWVLFPALALVSGLISSAYLLVSWYRDKERPRFLLLWAAGLFLMYWFQIPVILTNSGRAVTVTSFNLFFALTLPIVWIAIFCLFMGSIAVLGHRLKGRQKVAICAWFLAAVIFFAYHFITRKGVISTYSLPIVGNLIFYLPLYILIIATFLKKMVRFSFDTTWRFFLGAACVMSASILGIVRNFIVIKNILEFPPEFWFLVLTGQKIFFMLQTTSIILLVAGFTLLHRWYYKLHLIKTIPETQS